MNDSVLTARSLLFVPGHRPERFQKALHSGADAIILDLEDAVAEDCKDQARRSIGQKWRELQAASNTPVLVRSNPIGTNAWHEDVELLHALPGLAGLVLPKAESGEDLAVVRTAFPSFITLPLIESANGWANLSEISTAPGVVRLALGHLDFLSDTGMSPGLDEAEIAPLRFAITMHSRLAGLAAPIDGVTVQTEDEQTVFKDTHRARRFGFGGKLCIHPRQISAVHAGFYPTPEERRWAERVLIASEESNGSAVLVDGRMVDRPVLLKARALLAVST